ncbi:MAG: hypothetical protein H0U95_15455 [Bacteroidetes bacterium]|nr:hypothetical protein [Bacteroidota bacterium]
MKAHTALSDSTSNTYLAGTILFANVDYSGFGGYAIKAAIGGLIWMVFKLAGDYISHKMLEKKKNKEEESTNPTDTNKEN